MNRPVNKSGYGTSRFAVEGNSLFGQWTFGGDGLIPKQQRKRMGDHRIASYEWPFDSVRGYFINLSSHPAYEDFRRLRAQTKAAGKPLRSMGLVDGLKSYSEKGAEYVKTLKGIIRVNNLAIADDAKFRDEPMRFVMGAPDKASAKKLRQEIQKMKTSGEIEEILRKNAAGIATGNLTCFFSAKGSRGNKFAILGVQAPDRKGAKTKGYPLYSVSYNATGQDV